MKLRKFQDGGAVVTPEDTNAVMPTNNGETAQPATGEDPMVQIVEMFAQGLQSQDCNLLAQGAQLFLQLVQEAQGSAGMPSGGQPVFAKGGKLVSRKPASLRLVCK